MRRSDLAFTLLIIGSPLHGICLPRASLSICKNCGMISLNDLLYHVRYAQPIIDILLSRGRLEYLIELEISSLLNVLWVVIYIDDRARYVRHNLLRVGLLMRHQRTDPHRNLDSRWLLFHYLYNK